MTTRMQKLLPDGLAWQSLASRALLAASQLACIVSTAFFLDQTQQGYFATARSLLGLQVIFELGLSIVLVQIVAHETALSENGTGPQGDVGRILRFGVKWYAWIAVGYLAVLLPTGSLMFLQHGTESLSGWLWPWIAAVAAVALGSLLLPIQSFLDGSGHSGNIALMRGFQALGGASGFAAIAATGGGLWSLAGLVSGPVGVGLVWLALVHRDRLLASWKASRDGIVDWRREVFPFQWRIAISWICGWAIYQLYIPVLFAHRGPIEAGQMGLTLDACAGITSIGMALVSIRASGWGRLIALGKYSEIEIQFSKSSQSALVASIAASVVFLGGLLALRAVGHQIAARFLPTPALLPLVVAALLNQSIFSMATYLRAHRQEPYMAPTVVGALLLSLWTLVAGPSVGALGLAWGYLIVTAVVGVGWGSWIFARCRAQWHPETEPQ